MKHASEKPQCIWLIVCEEHSVEGEIDWSDGTSTMATSSFDKMGTPICTPPPTRTHNFVQHLCHNPFNASRPLPLQLTAILIRKLCNTSPVGLIPHHTLDVKTWTIELDREFGGNIGAFGQHIRSIICEKQSDGPANDTRSCCNRRQSQADLPFAEVQRLSLRILTVDLRKVIDFIYNCIISKRTFIVADGRHLFRRTWATT